MSLLEKAALDAITVEHSKSRCEICAIGIDLYAERLDMYVRQRLITRSLRDRLIEKIGEYRSAGDDTSLVITELLHMLGSE